MKQIQIITGLAYHLGGNDIDTDRIIPARFLMCVTFDGLGQNAFADDRSQLNGTHPFDLDENKEKNILIVDANFACGSSREHASFAIQQNSIDAIIGLSFAEIFRGNATGNGMACVTVSPENHAALLEQIQLDSTATVGVDLEMMEVWIDGESANLNIPCMMEKSDREMLMTGTWNTLTTCLEAESLIEETAARLPYLDLEPAA